MRRVRVSRRAMRDVEVYRLTRDNVWASLVRWLERGGAILESEKLAEELHVPMWTVVELIGVGKRRTLTPKKELRVKLGRSPDRADALALAVWDAGGAGTLELEDPQGGGGMRVSAIRTAEPDDDIAEGGSMDPYAGVNQWGGS